jgi:4-hydroxy-2-oxoheptanedioate aldolase
MAADDFIRQLRNTEARTLVPYYGYMFHIDLSYTSPLLSRDASEEPKITFRGDEAKARITVKKSRTLEKLRAGDFVRVVNINRVPEPWLTEVAGNLGFDVIWFDMEHRAHGYEVIDRLSLACRLTGADLMVRIRKTGYTSAQRPLEFGANGIMLPHCRSVEEARQWASWTRFPPQGTRGFDNAGADGGYALSNAVEFLQERNKETFLMVQIEDREAIDCVEDIAAVEGVDLMFVGPGDLTISYGIPMQREHPLIQRALDRVANAAAKAGKWWGTVTETPEVAQLELDRGARMVTCADDHFLLAHGMRDAYRQFENIKVREKSSHAG